MKEYCFNILDTGVCFGVVCISVGRSVAAAIVEAHPLLYPFETDAVVALVVDKDLPADFGVRMKRIESCFHVLLCLRA